MKKTLQLTVLITVLAMLAAVPVAQAEYSAAGEYPIVENYGDVTLTFLVVDHPAILDWYSNDFILWMNEQTNVQLEFEMVSHQDKKEKLNLMLSTGQIPDAIVGGGNNLLDDQLIRYGMDEGLLMPLNDLIEENCVYLKQMFEQYPQAEKIATMTDGKIYALPQINDCLHTYMPERMWINTTWLENLGLEMPTTIDEFYDVLVAFRDQDANGNGDPNDEIPLAGNTTGWRTSVEWFIMNSFCYYNVELLKDQTGDFGMFLDGDTVTTSFNDEGFKKGLEFLNKLYDEGLLYSASFNQDNDQMTQLVENPDACLVGCAAGGYAGVWANLGGDRYAQYDPLMPLTGPDGYVNVVCNEYIPIYGGSFAISSECQYPEVAIKWADLCYSQLATLNSYYGPEGEAWCWAEEGDVGLDGEPALYRQLIPWQETEPQSLHLVQQIPDFRDSKIRIGLADDLTKDIKSADRLETLLYQTAVAYQDYARPECKLPPLKFSVEEADAMMVAKTEVDRLQKEYVIGFITGTKDIANDYDTFLAELETAGMQTLIDHYQAAYDAQWKE